jgi:hypothetical protein
MLAIVAGQRAFVEIKMLCKWKSVASGCVEGLIVLGAHIGPSNF